VESLKRSEFWPIDLDAIGGLLELLKQQWLRKKHAKEVKQSERSDRTGDQLTQFTKSEAMLDQARRWAEFLGTVPSPDTLGTGPEPEKRVSHIPPTDPGMLTWRMPEPLQVELIRDLWPASLEPCAVCGRPAHRRALFARATGVGRDRIINDILLTLGLSGRFSASNLETFWNQYRSELCAGCTSQLDSLKSIKQQGLRLLEEAVRLDPSNAAAMQNLDAVRKWA
jgi:hypothetical protein